MTIQCAAGPERKKLAAALAAILGTKSTYAAAPTMAYIAGEYTITREGALVGPDDRDLVAALREQGFEPVEESYDSEPTEPEAEASQPQSDRLTIEVPIDSSFTPAKMANLEKLIASRESLLKKVLGADALPIKQADGVLRFPWFPADENATVYSQLTSALVRVAMEATRITSREKQAESEKFRMRTFLLRLGFIGDTYKQARKVLTRGLSGNGSYAKAKPSRYEGDGINSLSETLVDAELLHRVNQSMGADGTGMNSLAELMADEEMIREVNRSFEEDGE